MIRRSLKGSVTRTLMLTLALPAVTVGAVVVTATPTLAVTSVQQQAASPGDPPLPEYPGLSPRGTLRTLAAVDTTPTPCSDNGADKILSRSQVLTRARSWLAVGGIPYSQLRCYRNSYGDYRTDCSGFVSMAWGLGGSGSSFWTGNLMNRAFQISRSGLEPGDALLRHTGDPSENHVALFVRWGDSDHTQPIVIEQTGSSDTIERTWSASYAGLYTPVRYDNIVDDSLAGSPDDVSKDGVAVLTDGRIALYKVGADDDVWGRSQSTAGGSFNDWQRLSTGGGFAGRVAVLRDSSNRIALYVRRNGTIYGASQGTAGGPFSTWMAIGTNGAGVAGDPRAVYGSGGRIAIYATTSSGNVSGVSQGTAGGSFGSWQVLTTDGGYTGMPAAVVDSRERIALYVRRNGTIYGASQGVAGGSFGNWYTIGTNGAGVASDPAAVYGSAGTIAIYATNTGGDVSGVNQGVAGGAFGSWQVLTTTGGYTGKPAVLADSSSRIAIYVRRNGTIYGASQSVAGGSFGNWYTIGTNSPSILGDPTAVYGSGNRIAIYADTTGYSIAGTNQGTPGGAFGNWVVL